MDAAEKQAILERIRQSRGWVLPEQEFMVEHDRDFYSRQNELYEFYNGREGVLPQHFKEILYVVALAVRLPSAEAETYIKNHIRQALKLGATPEMILEALELCVFPAGGPSLMVGVKCLRAVLAEGAAAGAA